MGREKEMAAMGRGGYAQSVRKSLLFGTNIFQYAISIDLHLLPPLRPDTWVRREG
jgi:hypothetical protein